MREDLFPRDVGAGAQGFEQLPHRDAAQRLALAGEKHRAGMDAVLLAPFLQAAAEFGGQQDLPAFALAADASSAAADGLRRDELQLRQADAGGADGLEQQLAALVAGGARGVQQAEMLNRTQAASARVSSRSASQ